MHYFINNVGDIIEIDKPLKEAIKQAHKQDYFNYIGINKDDDNVKKWLEVFYPERNL